MQKKGVVGLVLISLLILLILNILKDLRSEIVILKLLTDNSLMIENSSNRKTVKCENFEVSVNMVNHPCGQTVEENSG